MTSNVLIIPVAAPLITALVMFSLRPQEGVLRLLSLASAAAQLASAALIFQFAFSEGGAVLEMGNWPAPYGIVFVSDLLSSSLVFVTALISLAAALYQPFGLGTSSERRISYPLLQFLLAGVYGAFLTGDLFNLFVWFEVLLISSFVLLSLGRSKPAMGGAFKYVLMNLFSSVLFLTAVGLIYGKLGTLNFAHLSVRAAEVPDNALLGGASVLLFCSFSLKAGLVPLHFWLPASYHNTSPLVSAVLGGLLGKVGVYAMLRVFTLVFPLNNSSLQTVLLIVSLASMIIGVLGAAAQTHFRRVLSFHIVSQIGYITLGLALYSPAAIAAAIFFLIHNMIAKSAMFLFGGAARKLCGTENLREQGGLFDSHLFLAILFLFPALSLAGLPPLSGFFAKFLILTAAIEADAWFSALVVLAVGLGTLFSMQKIWSEAFWKTAPERTGEPPASSLPLGAYAGMALLALSTLLIGLAAGLLFDICERAADQLLHNSSYISLVLGGS